MKAYLWEDLHAEVVALFWQPSPLAMLELQWVTRERDFAGMTTWGTSSEAVREYRTFQRKRERCISCDAPRDPKSKCYCTKHREEDRVRALAKARKRGVKPRAARVALCHPERKHIARGLCNACYQKERAQALAPLHGSGHV